MKCFQSPSRFLINSIKQKLNHSSFGKHFRGSSFYEVKSHGFLLCSLWFCHTQSYSLHSKSVREFSLKIFIKGN